MSRCDRWRGWIEWGVRVLVLGALAVSGVAGAFAAYALEEKAGGDAGDAEAAFRELEERLLKAPSVRLTWDITAEGALEAHLRGKLTLQEGDRLELDGSGPFGGSPMEVSLVSNGEDLRGGTKPRPFDISAPPALREAVVLGLTRMGLLHNLARLTAGSPPDRANGGVEEWVVVENVRRDQPQEVDGTPTVPLTFDVIVAGVPSATATLWLSEETGLPVKRTQTVRFGSDEMRVVERYGSFEAEAASP